MNEEEKKLNISNDLRNIFFSRKIHNKFLQINNKLFIIAIILIFINDIIIALNLPCKNVIHPDCKKIVYKEKNIDNYNEKKINFKHIQHRFLKEKNRPYLKEINKKRTFEKRFPLSKEINCKPHFSEKELVAFLSFLTKDTIFFETGSGCSSLIAKYYSKKSYAIEGCKKWYEKGIKNGLKDNLIFHDLKPDNPIWSYPGKKSDINDWKKYFQAYDKSYNADVILIDGRFKIATAMDIFDKINNDTIVLIHEYQDRPSYFILEQYYQYIYHWGTLVAFIKKTNIKTIPLNIQKKYWNKFL